ADDGARAAEELTDPTVIDVLNGQSGDEFAAVDGARATQPPAAMGLGGSAQAQQDAPDPATTLDEPASAPAGGAELAGEAEASATVASEAVPEPVAQTAAEPAVDAAPV